MATPHPYLNEEYEALPDGQVLVRDRATGREGIFRPDGAWSSGELTYSDIQFVRWIAETTVAEADPNV